METNTKIGPVDDVQLFHQRLLSLAAFIGQIELPRPEKTNMFALSKEKGGYNVDYDNLTFTWVIGLLPLIFGKYWAYGSTEKVILKSTIQSATHKCVQEFFGLSSDEYMHLFVAYFQNTEKYGGRILRHDMATGMDISGNIKELVRRKKILEEMKLIKP